jgi:hypothetical protein
MWNRPYIYIYILLIENIIETYYCRILFFSNFSNYQIFKIKIFKFSGGGQKIIFQIFQKFEIFRGVVKKFFKF